MIPLSVSLDASPRGLTQSARHRHIDVVGAILGQQVPLFLQDLEDAHPRVVAAALGAPGAPPVVDIEEVFHLYRRSVDILRMHDQHCPE